MSKYTCEAQKRLPISFLRAEGYLNVHSYRSGSINWSWRDEKTDSASIVVPYDNPHVQCKYTITDNWSGDSEHLDYQVKLLKTPCYFGGHRYWFACPKCYSRVGVLYLVSRYFTCRRCNDLAYESQQETHTSDFSFFLGSIRRAWGIEEAMDNLRVKFWKGRPTKRYKKLLRDFARTQGRLGSSKFIQD